MFVCRVLCCLTFVLNLLIVFVLATNLLPRGRSSSKTLCSGCQTGRRHLSCANAGIVCLLVANIIMVSVVVVLFPAMFLQEKDLYRLRFNRSQWFFSWAYGVTCGAIPFFLTSAAIITYDNLLSPASSAALMPRQTTLLKPVPSSQPLTFKEADRQFHGCA